MRRNTRIDASDLAKRLDALAGAGCDAIRVCGLSTTGSERGDPFQQLLDFRARLHAAPHAIDLVQGSGKLWRLDRFQQIIHGVDAKGLQRVLIVRRGKYDQRLRFELGKHLGFTLDKRELAKDYIW